MSPEREAEMILGGIDPDVVAVVAPLPAGVTWQATAVGGTHPAVLLSMHDGTYIEVGVMHDMHLGTDGPHVMFTARRVALFTGTRDGCSRVEVADLDEIVGYTGRYGQCAGADSVREWLVGQYATVWHPTGFPATA